MSITRTDYLSLMTGLDIPEGQSNDVEVRRFEISEKDAELFRLRSSINGRRTMVRPGEYTALFRSGGLWMSNTPDEANDHVEFVIRCEHEQAEHVLVNGLGLGMVIVGLCAIPSVKHIDVVEIDPDVIALVEPFCASVCRANGVTLTVHHDDAYRMVWPKLTRWDAAWHDIWQDISTGNLPLMTDLHRKYGRRVGFQDSWKRDDLRYMRRRGW